MLSAMGLQSLDELYAHLPKPVRIKRPLTLAPGLSEYEIVDYFNARGKNAAEGYASFLGAGVYQHYRPVMCDVVASRGEFLTSYTPYQAEIAQGTLVTIFEFQTMICQLTGMEVANASMYDGSSAAPEAAMMACRVTGRDKVVVARSVHPEYRQVLDTYMGPQGLPVLTAAYDAKTGRIDLDDLSSKVDEQTAAVLIQSPNFFGVIEDVAALAEVAHKKGALLVFLFTEAVSLGLLAPPAEADIVAGELQSFAISPSYGGPFTGIIATKDKFVRQIPGRLVGETVDNRGQRAFCLTLSTREQHIRREKATSNICTNQALIALMATVYLSIYGKEGLRELALQNLAKAHYLGGQVPQRFTGAYFNEFVAPTGAKVNPALRAKKILGGLPIEQWYPELKGCALWCATEMNKKAEMDAVVEAFSQ